MNTIRCRAFLLAWFFYFAGALPAGAQALEADESASPQTRVELERAVTEILESSTIPGASMVVIENGAIAWVQHYGVMDRESGRAVTDDTVFRAGSISKSLTSIAAMMLVEGGALTLDAQVREFVPELDLRNPWAPSDPVRLVHLLEHTAGFNDIAFRHYLLEGGGLPLAEVVEPFGPYISRWRPGTLTSYSNQGPIVAARMLEIAAGAPFEDFMRTSVTEPMGMNSASWRGSDGLMTRLATSYRPDGVTQERFIDTPGWPSGGLNVTARDLARLPLLMLGRGTLDGQTLLSPESVARIETPNSSDAARAGLRHGYGLGNVVMPRGRAVFQGHDGSIDGFVATYAYAPELGAGYVLMANATSDAIFEVAAQVRGYLERGLPAPVVVPSLQAAAHAQAWAGQYQVLTPRRSLLAGLIGLTQWEGARVIDGNLRFRGGNWVGLGEGLWQHSDAVVPELVLIKRDGDLDIQTGLAAYRRVPAPEMWAKLLGLAGYASLMVIGIPHAVLVAWSGVRRGFADRGGIALRLWPLLALYAVAGIVIYALALLQTGDLEFLGRPTIAAWGLFAWSVLAPVVVGLAAASLWLRRPGAGRGAVALASGYTVMALVACAYLATHGWIGLKLWNA
ncbi:MAG: serine hydrolase [Wenzhouxiangella sp.]|jgi:CubicO group peptidase (beta-lactamase class C family)|nr:serine hydrolase [Wenzhouxiangella sp.]